MAKDKVLSNDFESVRARKRPYTTETEIVLDHAYSEEAGRRAQRVIQLRQRRDAARIMLDAVPDNDSYREDLEAAQVKLDEAQAHFDAWLEDRADHVVVFKFRGLRNEELDKLQEIYPATAEQIARARKLHQPEPAYDVGLYPPALVAAAMTEPAWTADQVRELWDDTAWGPGELADLFMAAEGASTRKAAIPNLGEG